MKDMKAIEMKVFKTNFQDGLWDIFFGIMMLGSGVTPIARPLFPAFGLPEQFSSMVFPFLAVLVVLLGKHFVTRPMMGMVRFSKERESKLHFARLAAVGAVVFTALLLFATSGIDIAGFQIREMLGGLMVPLLLSLMVTSILGVMAYFMDFPRMYIIAAVFGSAMFLTELGYAAGLGKTAGLLFFGLGGSAVLAYGVRLHLRFLKEYRKGGEKA